MNKETYKYIVYTTSPLFTSSFKQRMDDFFQTIQDSSQLEISYLPEEAAKKQNQVGICCSILKITVEEIGVVNNVIKKEVSIYDT